jgi:GAF domain-containing protein
MPAALMPLDEPERLQSWNALKPLATLPRPHFGCSLSEATDWFEMPRGASSLVDSKRQWFKARRGLDVAETPRSVSFRSHALLRPPTPLCEPDALDDTRFADHPLVTGEASIRFSFGVPICCPEDRPLGARCVVDQVPREMSRSDVQPLLALADNVRANVRLQGV